MKYSLIFSESFKADVKSAYQYITNELSSPKAAKSLISNIIAEVDMLMDMPYMYPALGSPFENSGYRKLTVKNYVIIYSVDENSHAVNLLRCFGGRQNCMKYLR